MSVATELRSSTTLAVTLPERVFTRSGSSFDPRGDLWVWTDGVFEPRIDFGRYNNRCKALVPSLKQTLIQYVKRHSSGYVLNLDLQFHGFLTSIEVGFEGVITPQHFSNFAARASTKRKWRLAGC